MTKSIAFTAQKGGVGKTTTVLNLGVAWATQGQRVLVVDLDAQFALTRWCGISLGQVGGTIAEVLQGMPVAEAVLPVAPGLELLPATRKLRMLEVALAGEDFREQFVAHRLQDAETARYDLVLFDCPPNLGLLTINALVAANEVIVPIKMTDEGALQGAAEVATIVRRMPAETHVRTLVRTMADPRRIVHQRVDEGLPSLGLPVADTQIPRLAEFENAAAERRPLVLWKPHSTGAAAYRQLAAELADAAVAAR